MSNAAINGPDIDANALSGAYQQLTSYLPVQPLVLPYPVRSSRMASTSQKKRKWFKSCEVSSLA